MKFKNMSKIIIALLFVVFTTSSWANTIKWSMKGIA